MPVGVDTSFFFALQKEHPEALALWHNEAIITSSIAVYELYKKFLTGEFKSRHILSQIDEMVEVIPVNSSIARKAANINHTFGIPSLDSLIISSLVEAGCKKIYSADPHFEQFKEKNIKIVKLKKSDS
jgi:predicted nucleic acid-binding protein